MIQEYQIQLGIFVVVMAPRLLKDKGVHEFIEAARLLVSRGVIARFQIIGEPDLGNPESVSYDSLKIWKDEGIVEYLGYFSNIPEIFSKAQIVALPSYYGEGLPKVLIETLANAIERLILDINLRNKMAKADRVLVEKDFVIEKFVDAHMAIYCELLDMR